MILENNLKLLDNLSHQFPENFEGLTNEGNYLVYKEDKVDISQYNLYMLISGENPSFGAQLSVLSPDDIFRMIKINVSYSNINFKDNEKEINKEEDFYNILSKASITDDERRRLNGYYSFINDCIIYENLLEPNIVDCLHRFGYQVMTWESSNESLTVNQKEAINKYYEMQLSKENNKNNSLDDKDYNKDNVVKLTFKKKDEKNAAYVSTVQVIWFILAAILAFSTVAILVLD